MWTMWTRFYAPQKSLDNTRNFRHFFQNNYPHKNKKYPQPEVGTSPSRSVDIVDKLDSEEIFPDFMHVSGTHSYQHITLCAIF